MKNAKRYFVQGAFLLVVGTLLVLASGCDYGYDWDDGGALYSGPSRGSYYYLPYRSYSYGWYNNAPSYRSYGLYGRGLGRRSFYGRYCD
jgi:hypothetical protein